MKGQIQYSVNGRVNYKAEVTKCFLFLGYFETTFEVKVITATQTLRPDRMEIGGCLSRAFHRVCDCHVRKIVVFVGPFALRVRVPKNYTYPKPVP